MYACCVPHLQTQLQAVPVLSSLYPSRNSFSSFTFPGAPYRIFLPFLPWLPCHFYLVVITTTNRAAMRDHSSVMRDPGSWMRDHSSVIILSWFMNAWLRFMNTWSRFVMRDHGTWSRGVITLSRFMTEHKHKWQLLSLDIPVIGKIPSAVRECLGIMGPN